MNAILVIDPVNLAGALRTAGLPDDAVIINLSFDNGLASVHYSTASVVPVSDVSEPAPAPILEPEPAPDSAPAPTAEGAAPTE